MIYVLTANQQQFQNFLQEFHCREHFGSGGNREGQVRRLFEPRQLRGIDRALVLTWGEYGRCIHATELINICAARDIAVVHVPDLRRERYFREKRNENSNLPL
jgi:hypothetical protein